MRLWTRPRLALALASLLAGSSTAAAQLQIVHRGDTGRIVIFVHGIWSDPDAAFRPESGTSLLDRYVWRKPATMPSWPELIASDPSTDSKLNAMRGSTLATFGYPTSSDSRLSLPDIAVWSLENLALSLEDGGKPGYSEIYFVAHSLGGLAVERILLNDDGQGGWISKRTKAVFMLATPSAGAEAANFVTLLPEWWRGRPAGDLHTLLNNSYLQQLRTDWAAFLRRRRIAGEPVLVRCARETERTGAILIVPEDKLDPTCESPTYPVTADHISIVKPHSRDAGVYRWLQAQMSTVMLPAVAASAPEKSPEPLAAKSTPTEKPPKLPDPPQQPVVAALPPTVPASDGASKPTPKVIPDSVALAAPGTVLVLPQTSNVLDLRAAKAVRSLLSGKKYKVIFGKSEQSECIVAVSARIVRVGGVTDDGNVAGTHPSAATINLQAQPASSQANCSNLSESASLNVRVGAQESTEDDSVQSEALSGLLKLLAGSIKPLAN